MGSGNPRYEEKVCIDAYLCALEEATGRSWRVDRWLDADYPDSPSPECIVTDGKSQRAVEVKGLYDEESPSALGSANTLAKRLNPKVDGRYTIMLPRVYRSQRHPEGLVQNVQREIERVGPALARGEPGYIRVHHHSLLSVIGAEPEYACMYCSHAEHPGVLDLTGRVEGFFQFHDEGTAGELHSDDAIRDVRDILLRACGEMIMTGRRQQQVKWYEEWKLIRARGSGVHIATWVAGWEGPETIRPPLTEAITAGAGKFAARDWAPIRVLLIYDQFLSGTETKDLEAAFQEIESSSYARLDEIWALSRGTLVPLYTRPAPTVLPAPSPPATS